MDLERELEFGFADFLPLEKRIELVRSATGIAEFRKRYNCNFSREVSDTVKWLEGGSERSLWMCTDKGYPRFTDMPGHIPYFLMVEGSIPQQGVRSAVVGTRRADWDGLQESFRLGLELSMNGICVVTGNAEGCDQSAICGALKAGDEGFRTPCISVLGCGLDVEYPYGSMRLRERIIEAGGSVISRFAPKMPPLRHNFPSRNMVLAALANICIVVQCPDKSGALITADLAMQMGRDLYVSQAGIKDTPCCRGTRKLYGDGCELFEERIKLDIRAQRAQTGIRFGSAHYRIHAAGF